MNVHLSFVIDNDYIILKNPL